jgi:hypothetical protein
MTVGTHMMGGIEGVHGPDNVAGRGRKGVYCACSMPCRYSKGGNKDGKGWCAIVALDAHGAGGSWIV